MTELNLGSAPGKTPIPRKRVPLLRILIYFGIALSFVIVISVARFFAWAQCFDLHGFRSSGGSMCPTICEGEFVLAGMDAYHGRAPERGEVILFDHDESGTKCRRGRGRDV